MPTYFIAKFLMTITHMRIMTDSSIAINNNTDNFILRTAKLEDKDFIFNLLKENMLESFKKHWGFWNEKSFEENYHQEQIRIIEYNNVRIGYLDFKFKSDCGYTNNIQIRCEFRDKGIGTKIMKLIEQETKKHGLNKMRLKSFKDSRAVNLYKRLGYKKILEDDTSIILEKQIF